MDLDLTYQGAGETASAFALTIRPRTLAATFRSVPYRLDNITGVITVNPDTVTLKDLAATHGQTKIALAGTGSLSGRPTWDLTLSANNLRVDEEFISAAPSPVSWLLKTLKIQGKSDLSFSTLIYRQEPETPATSPSTQPAPGPDLEFAAKVAMADTRLDAGFPCTDLQGTLDLAGTVAGGKLADLSGSLRIDSARMANRPIRNFRAELTKPPEYDALQIGKIQAEIAGGEIAGEVNLAFPDDGPSRYALALDLRNADIRALTQDNDSQISGQLAASLALEGSWNNTADRRGRGDVVVAGKRMYHIPVVLGLLQITNLSLPLSGPFNEATARYTVDGRRVTFEQIELRASNMLMQGSGSLDFGTKKMNMTFVTDNPSSLRVPFLSDLMQSVQHELLRIHVAGSIEEPKVSASAMTTFTTTIDQVFKGSPVGNTTRPKRK